MRGGESLASIASDLWGDSSLWYKLAEANGLTGEAALAEGQTLVIPTGVLRNTHNARTFEPYDPNSAIGDTSPTNAKPPKKAKCGLLGQILLVVIAVAVTIATKGAATAFFSSLFGAAAGATTGAAVVAGTIVGGAVAGAAGSIVSQGVGLATGIQDKFSFKSVGLAAIGGGIGAGIGGDGLNVFGKVSSDFLRGALTGGVSSAVTQGIGVATGLQAKFSFAGVAGAALGGGLNARFGDFGIDGYGGQLAANTASGVVNAATRSLINGTSFGDNILAALPDIIGGTIGSAIGDQIAIGEGATVDVGAAVSGQTAAQSAAIEAANIAYVDEIVVRGTRSATQRAEEVLAGVAHSRSLERQLKSDEQAATATANYLSSTSRFLPGATKRLAGFGRTIADNLADAEQRAEQREIRRQALIDDYERQVEAARARYSEINITGRDTPRATNLVTSQGPAGLRIDFVATSDLPDPYLTPRELADIGLAFAGIINGPLGRLTSSPLTAQLARGRTFQAGVAGINVASGIGPSGPANVVRIIQRGERVGDLINDGKSLTFTTGNEHAVVTLANGQRDLVSGGPGGIRFAPGEVKRVFGHTHPTSAPPSANDFIATRELGQSRQYVFHGGQVTVVRPVK